MVKQDIVKAKLIEEILNEDFSNVPIEPVLIKVKRRILSRYPVSMRKTATYIRLKAHIGDVAPIKYRDVPKPKIINMK